MSKSTRNYDRSDKFAAYQTIPSFQEYWLVDQYTSPVESYVKSGEKRWIFQEYDSMGATLTLESCEFTIALEDIYDKVQFEPALPESLEEASQA